MSFLDILICVPLLYAAYKGFVRGLIIEVASLIALVAGIYGGVHFSNISAEYINQYLEISGTLLSLVSFVVTFILIVAGIFLLAKMLEKVVNLVALKLANKIAGVIFGILKMGLIVSVVLLIISSIDNQVQIIPAKTKDNSILYGPFTDLSSMLVPTLKKLNWYPDQPEPRLENPVDSLKERIGASQL